ncbi:MAG: Hpt domain-containing protein [Kangiellaceae bacterium]|nr:Hpt domain-containing protein [Kangiellaceae bacterium]
MTDNYDQLALSWVRKEINNTLEQARQGLETYVEDNHDKTQIQFCINCLHQVQGTLQMLGFDGAARLAAEMETLAEQMAKEKEQIGEASFEILMRSMMQMPGYLERVESGQKDIPVILLPLINELRAASNLAPVNENEFFSAETGHVEPPKPNEQITEQEKKTSFQDNCKKLRAHFQKGLTGVIRGASVKESLARIHKVLLRLEALTEGHSVAKLWWVADGFIFSIAERGLYKEKQVHLLLSHVDKQIKRLSEAGESALTDQIPAKLLSKLLYFVARSKSKNTRVKALKDEFNLEESLPESKTIKKQQQQLARPDSSAMESVITAIGEELASVKDQLDLFVRAQAKDPAQLTSLNDSLEKIADTLTILELPIPRDVIREQTKTLKKSIRNGQLPDDAAIMDIAGALLFVDANLSNFDIERFAAEEQVAGEQAESIEKRSINSQVDDATVALVGVARKNLQLAKDGMINFIASSFNAAELDNVPALLTEVLGAMRIVEYREATNVLVVAESYVTNCLLGISVVPTEEYLDALADIITSVDYYLEGTEEGNSKAIVSILHSAQSSIDLLSNAIERAAQEPVESGQDFSEEVITEEISQPTSAVIVPINQSSADKQIDESLIDEEVLEIFLEEAEEEIEVVGNTLPVWINDTKNQDALATIRRSFHTLKGSGRLVGASTIGELSWSIENMLNRVIEESIPAEQPVLAAINDALLKLPNLVKEFSDSQAHAGTDIEELIARTDHISKGLNLSDFSFADGCDVEVIDNASSNNEEFGDIPTLSEELGLAQEEEPIDPVLLEIFVNEAQVHLSAINQYIDGNASDNVPVTDDLIRALHTLKGSAHMAKVDAIAKLAGPLEKHSRIIKGSNRRFDADSVVLLADAAKFINGVVTQLRESKVVDSSPLELLLERINAIAASKTSGQVIDGAVQQRDQRLVSIFLTEGSDILGEVQSLIQARDKSNHIQIADELHTFTRGSEMIGIEEIQNFASVCEQTSRANVRDEDSENEFYRLLSAGVDELSAMLSRLVSEEDIVAPIALSEEMLSWISEVSKEEAPEEMDQELVELFVEEADELIETASELLERWKNNLHSDDLLKELRRIYHTFKGSSRMAGAMSIGDLSYGTEEIFNTHLDFARPIGDADYQLVTMATNKLIEMIEVLRGFQWPEAAEAEERMLNAHLNPDSVIVEPTTSESGVEEIAIETSLEDTSDIEFSETDFTETTFVETNLADNEPVESEVTVIESEELDTTETELVNTEQEITTLVSPPELTEIVDEGEVSAFVSDESNIEYLAESNQSEESLEAELPVEIQDSENEEIQDSDPQESDYAASLASESNEFFVTEDTIAPAAPVVASGNVYPIELDEDGLEVLEIYLEEADELLISFDEAMHQWGDNLTDNDAIDTMQRNLHTFKGGARLADLVVLGDLTHEMETYFEKVNEGTLTAKPAHVDFMLRGYDVIEGLVKEVKEQNQMTMPVEYFEQLQGLIAGQDPQMSESESSSPLNDQQSVTESAEETTDAIDTSAELDSTVAIEKETSAEIVSFEQRKAIQEEKRKPAQVVDTVRVNSNQLENLVNLAGETSIFRSRLEQQMTVLRYNLDEMSSTVERLKDQLRNLDIETEAQISYRREISGGTEYEDFDPLEMDRYTRQQELTRGLGESAVDLMNLKETLDFLTSDSETLLLQQGRVNTEMQESLMQTRMTPFESLVPRLRRMVRQISTELGKTIELSISADGEMDRSVLERMIAPLEHMLRNAMDHGIESPEERKNANKAETGKISISLYREGSEVFIKIKDDGRGLNLDAIRMKAIERGIINGDTELNRHELHQLILEAGFSTAEKVTQISGRGVGMDVVNSEIKQMGGVIDINSEHGLGSTFTVRLPFTVSVNHALMVQIGEEVYAIPLSNIEGIVRVSPFELEEYYTNTDSKFAYAGIDYSMYYLGQMLNHNTRASLEGVSQPLPVLLLHGADHPTALQVDDLLGSREIVVKSIGSQLSSVSGLSGATIQGDGRVVLILDMPALIRRVDAHVTDMIVQEEAISEEKVPTVMVVDDSITVRKVTTRLLERYDFEVITAKDGVDAVTVLADTIPDVMLLDIEMPRMDGFELATIIRHDERLKKIPIIMITSRTGEKHRKRAESIGVNQYMGKPYNEVDLLETINGLLTDNS